MTNYKLVPLNNGEERPVIKSPGGTALGCLMDPVTLLKGESLVFDFNEDYTMVRMFKKTPYTEPDLMQ
jgi:hypothetical protein